MKLIFEMFVALVLVGCATSTLQTDAFLGASHNIPNSKLIDGVPFINQSEGHCGPATLAMTLNWAGIPVSIQEIAPQVYNPKMKGSLQTDMISASRRNGALAIPIEGIHSLINELAAGHPVIVFENLALAWLPQWHFAVAIGYDQVQEKIIMHSGPEAFKYWDLRKFERSWKLGDYWGLVVLPPNRLSATANEVAHLKAAAGLEQVEKIDEAKVAYQAILTRWKESLGAYIGLANIAFAGKDYSSAVRYLKKASQFHPESAIAWHNLAIAQGYANMKEEARMSAKKAIRLASIEAKAAYAKNLEEWIQN